MEWFKRKLNHLPLGSGQYVPGTMDVMTEYSEAGLFMRLYYPTNAKKDLKTNQSKWFPWIPNSQFYDKLAHLLMVYAFLLRIWLWLRGQIYIPALFGAKIHIPDQKLKCILVSHGLGGQRYLYSSTCCELASHGYLVVAIEHRDHSATTTHYYASKEDAMRGKMTEIRYKRIKFGKGHLEAREKQVEQRANEILKLLDFVMDLNKGNVPYNVLNDAPETKNKDFNLSDLVNNINLTQISLMGHSFGGATALLAMSKRPELTHGILLDPWMFPIKKWDLPQKISQPLLFVNTQTFHIKSNCDAMEKYLGSNDREMYTILHTTHENQTDSVLVAGYWMNWFMKKLDPVLALEINNSIILLFLNKHLGIPEKIDKNELILKQEKRNYETGLTKPWAV